LQTLENKFSTTRQIPEAVNGIGDGIKTAVEKSMKDERLKADLITNVSHDIICQLPVFSVHVGKIDLQIQIAAPQSNRSVHNLLQILFRCG